MNIELKLGNKIITITKIEYVYESEEYVTIITYNDKTTYLNGCLGLDAIISMIKEIEE